MTDISVDEFVPVEKENAPERRPHPVTGCGCAEGRTQHGRIKFMPAVHDCEYIVRRNAHIPEASRMASHDTREKYLDYNGDPRKHPYWSKSFMEHMNALTFGTSTQRAGALIPRVVVADFEQTLAAAKTFNEIDRSAWRLTRGHTPMCKCNPDKGTSDTKCRLVLARRAA